MMMAATPERSSSHVEPLSPLRKQDPKAHREIPKKMKITGHLSERQIQVESHSQVPGNISALNTPDRSEAEATPGSSNESIPTVKKGPASMNQNRSERVLSKRSSEGNQNVLIPIASGRSRMPQHVPDLKSPRVPELKIPLFPHNHLPQQRRIRGTKTSQIRDPPSADLNKEIEDFVKSKTSFEGKNIDLEIRRMVVVCRILFAKPKILLVSEEALNFGEGVVANLVTLRKELPTTTIVCLLNDHNNLLDYDRIYFLDAGKILEKGDPSKLVKDPGSYIHKLLKETDSKTLARLHTEINNTSITASANHSATSEKQSSTPLVKPKTPEAQVSKTADRQAGSKELSKVELIIQTAQKGAGPNKTPESAVSVPDQRLEGSAPGQKKAVAQEFKSFIDEMTNRVARVLRSHSHFNKNHNHKETSKPANSKLPQIASRVPSQPSNPEFLHKTSSGKGLKHKSIKIGQVFEAQQAEGSKLVESAVLRQSDVGLFPRKPRPALLFKNKLKPHK